MSHMAKTAVYSWRLSPDTKSSLEYEARRRGESVAELLDRVIGEWLESERKAAVDDEAEQARLHAAAMRCAGIIEGDDPYRAERASELVGEILRKKYGR